jgi:hypothetical protein
MNYSPILSQTSYGNINNNGFTAFNGFDDPSFEKYDDKFKNKSQKVYKNHNTVLKGMAYCDKDRGDSGISEIYFSPENIKRLQKMIRKEVYMRTQGKYRLETDQDEADLLIAMRCVYYEYCRFLPFQVIRQVKNLNRKLIESIVPEMITNLKQQYSYIKEINEPLKPIDRPLNVSNAGRKTLPAMSTIFF